MKNDTTRCPFCERPVKDGRTCGRAACQAKAAVWSSKRGR